MGRSCLPTLLTATAICSTRGSISLTTGRWLGDITVRAFTLPLGGASTVVGTVNLGSLPSWSGRNIRVAEDVLMPMMAVPYTADGGNLVLEITIDANRINGTAQVFQHDLSSFGIYELKLTLTS